MRVIPQNELNKEYYDNFEKLTNKYDFLDQEDLLDLFIEAKKENNIKAKETIINSYLRLVLYCSHKYINTSLSIEDIISEGLFALMESFDKYDYMNFNKFSSYALTNIERRIFSFVSRETLYKKPVLNGKRLTTLDQIYHEYKKDKFVFESLDFEENEILDVESEDFLNEIEKNNLKENLNLFLKETFIKDLEDYKKEELKEIFDFCTDYYIKKKNNRSNEISIEDASKYKKYKLKYYEIRRLYIFMEELLLKENGTKRYEIAEKLGIYRSEFFEIRNTNKKIIKRNLDRKKWKMAFKEYYEE